MRTTAIVLVGGFALFAYLVKKDGKTLKQVLSGAA